MKQFMLASRDFAPWLMLLILILATLGWYLFSTRAVKSYTYKQTDQGEMTLKVHFPSDWASDDKRSLIVFFFGGGWVEGSMEQFHWQADYFAQRGLVAARVDYRVDSRHGTSPKQAVEDGHDALVWLQEHAAELGINPAQVIAAGGSAGGHIAACTALCSYPNGAHPAALVLLNPVLDLTNASQALEFSTRELELINEIGKEASAELSPNLNINQRTPPTLIVIGSNDPLMVQAIDYRNRAIEVGVPVKLKVAQQQGHGFFNKEPWRSAVVHLIDAYLIETHLATPANVPQNAQSEAASMFRDQPENSLQPKL